MKNVEQLVRARRSVRTFETQPLTEVDKEKLCSFMENITNPYGQSVEFRFLEGMSSPVIVGTELFVAGKIKKAPHMNEAFGYSFEKLVLFAQSLGIGTVWIGGTMDRPAFEKAAELAADEMMPCVSPLGYPAKKMSLREKMMRTGVQADARLPFEELVFCERFDKPLSQEAAGDLFLPLEMVRLAPSAVNKQPWRIVVCDHMVHFYLMRSKGFGGGELDMQKIDLGIALCHFDLVTREQGIQTEFTIADPGIDMRDGMEYIASYKLLR